MVCLWLAGDGASRRQAWTARILQNGKECMWQRNPFLFCIRQVSIASPSQLLISQRLSIPPVPKHSAQGGCAPPVTQWAITSQSKSPIPQARLFQSEKALPCSCKALARQALCTGPISVLPKSFEGMTEVRPQTNCPLEPPHKHGAGADSTVWLSRHGCQ